MRDDNLPSFYILYFLLMTVTSLLGIMIPISFASCPHDDDWPEKPCPDLIINGTVTYDEKIAWQEYYEIKGKQWMESKREEMVYADNHKILKEWYEYGRDQNNFANSNVWYYYNLHGQSPNIQQYYAGVVERNFLDPVITYYYISPMVLGIAIASTSIGGVVIFRKIKQEKTR